MTPLPEDCIGRISRGKAIPKNGSYEKDDLFFSTFILTTAGPTFSIASVIAVLLVREIGSAKRIFTNIKKRRKLFR